MYFWELPFFSPLGYYGVLLFLTMALQGQLTYSYKKIGYMMIFADSNALGITLLFGGIAFVINNYLRGITDTNFL